jgi:dihydroneopterin aldolase
MNGGDLVFIRGLAIDALIGVHQWERGIRQTLLIDLEMQADIRAAAATDRLGDTLDYHAVAERVKALVRESSFQLLEALAERIATTLLAEFGIGWLRLRLAKPGAVPGAQDVGVLIERSRSG